MRGSVEWRSSWSHDANALPSGHARIALVAVPESEFCEVQISSVELRRRQGRAALDF